MTKDKLNHKKLRALKTKGAAKDAKDENDARDGKVRDEVNVSFGKSRVTQEKSSALRDESRASHSKEKSQLSHASRTSHTSHASHKEIDVVAYFRRWMELVEKRTADLQELPEKKSVMRNKILGKIRKYVEEAERGMITVEELKNKISPLYTAIREKYGNIVRVK